jgi:hypothetical protein
MKAIIRRLPSPALVISLIALFVALGGTVYAASQISGKQIEKNSLPGNRVKSDTLTGKQVKESSLGTVPSATKANTATTATSATSATSASTATTAANANALGGLPSSAFEPKSRWAIVDATKPTGEATIVAQSGGITLSADIGTFTYLDFGSDQSNTHIQVSYGRLTSGEDPLSSGVCGFGGPGGTICIPAGTNTPNHIVVSHDATALYYIVVSPN